MREEDVAIARVREEEKLLSSEAAQATLEYCHSDSDVLKAIKIFKTRNGKYKNANKCFQNSQRTTSYCVSLK